MDLVDLNERGVIVVECAKEVYTYFYLFVCLFDGVNISGKIEKIKNR